jgi:AraC family transcriptional regulator
MSTWAGWDRVRFAFGGHGLAVYPAGATFGPRTNGDFELVWIVEGDAVWIADGVEHAAPPGTVILTRPGMRDAFRWDERRDSRHGYVHFSLQMDGVGCPPMAEWPLLRMCGSDSVVLPLLRQLLRILDLRGPAWEELAQGAARQALLSFLVGGDGVAGEETLPTPVALERALLRLREAWRGEVWSPVSISALARAAGVSREHLTRAFQRHFATSPREAQLALRLDRGAQLLVRTSLPVHEVSRLCGFSDQFHFSRRFRTAYGASPRAFRLRIAAGGAMPMPPLVRVRNVVLG